MLELGFLVIEQSLFCFLHLNLYYGMGHHVLITPIVCLILHLAFAERFIITALLI